MTAAPARDDLELGLPVVDVDKAADADLRCYSVTTLIGALDKPALVYWSAEQTALAAVHQYNAWVGLAKQNRAAAVDWLKRARLRTNEGELSAADLGTTVHAAIEQYTLTGVRPDNEQLVQLVRTHGGAEFNFEHITAQVQLVDSMVEQFDRWCQEFTPSYEATEVTVYSPTYGYAGTCDGFASIDGVPAILDYKTSRKSFSKKGDPTKPYSESVALQLAAYRYAELAAVWRPRRFEQFRRRYYLISDEERALAVPVPKVEFGLAIHITPEHCMAYPVRCDEKVFDAFLFVVEAARWVFQDSKNVMGFPLTRGAS